MGVKDREVLERHSLRSAIMNHDFVFSYRSLRAAIPIREVVASLRYRLQVFVDVVGTGRCVHPASAVVEALIDEELSPRHRTVGIEPLLARDLDFGAEEKRGVRIDEEQRVMRKSIGGRDGNAV